MGGTRTENVDSLMCGFGQLRTAFQSPPAKTAVHNASNQRLPMETWATFSIIDHRKPLYRQALALFDRIVVPLPPKPIGDQTQQELDQLRAEIDYLSGAGAAEPYTWSSAAFEDWRKPYLAAALSAGV